MNARYLLPDKDEELRQHRNEIMAEYSADVNPLENYFNGEKYYEESNAVQIRQEPLFITDGNRTDENVNEEDLSNVRIIHNDFISLAPAQAANPYLWDYYAFANPDYRHYLIVRFHKGDLMKRCIVQNWQYDWNKHEHIQREAYCTVHGLARLWWYGYLTYDEGASNPYHFTETLFHSQRTAQDIIMTSSGMNPTRVKGELQGIQEFQDKHSSFRITTDHIREFNKYWNHEGAVKNLNLLLQDEIAEASTKALEKICHL